MWGTRICGILRGAKARGCWGWLDGEAGLLAIFGGDAPGHSWGVVGYAVLAVWA